MRHQLMVLVLTLAILALYTPGTADSGITVEINGAVLSMPPDQSPMIEQGTTLIPLRIIAESIGAEITWDGETRLITLQRGGALVELTVGSDRARVNGRVVRLQQPSRIVSDRTYVPLRFVSEALGAVVGWDGATRRISVQTKVPENAPRRFASAGLELSVRALLGKPVEPLLDADLKQVTTLTARHAQIDSLDGIEHLSNLESLDLEGNRIRDLEPLRGLTGLTRLILNGNPLEDTRSDQVLVRLRLDAPTAVWAMTAFPLGERWCLPPGTYEWLVNGSGYTAKRVTQTLPKATAWSYGGGIEAFDYWAMMLETDCTRTSSSPGRLYRNLQVKDGLWSFIRMNESEVPDLQLEILRPDGRSLSALGPLEGLKRLTALGVDRITPYDGPVLSSLPSVAVKVALPQPARTAADIRQKWAALQPRFQGNPMVEPARAEPPYETGRVHPDFLEDGTNMANFVRYLALQPDDLTSDPELSRVGQHGAVLLSRIGHMDHTPPRPSDMEESFFKLGYQATSTSNLFHGVNTLHGTVKRYMRDEDPPNIDKVGHRRWILSPTLLKVGFGFSQIGNFSTMAVFDGSRKPPVPYDLILWPGRGLFPTSFFDEGDPWSISVNPEHYKLPSAGVEVRLKRVRDQREWILSETRKAGADYFRIDRQRFGRNGPAVIFRPDASKVGEIHAGDRFDVTVSGMLSATGDVPVDVSYEVEFFALE